MSTLIKKSASLCFKDIFQTNTIIYACVKCLEGELASSGCDAGHTWTAQVSPFLEQCILQLCSGHSSKLPLLSTSTQNVLGIFNKRRIRTNCWLMKRLDMIVILKVIHYSHCGQAGIVLSKQPQGGVLLQECHKYRWEHFMLVPLSWTCKLAIMAVVRST